MSVNDYDHDLFDRIRALVEDGDLEEESAAYGIAMQVVHHGRDTLSRKQLYIYENHVERLLQGLPPRVGAGARPTSGRPKS
jgi:hypothetical protein